MDPKLKFYNTATHSFAPQDNVITLATGDKVSYDQVVVAPGVRVDFSSIAGLSEALANPNANVSSTYSYDYCDKVFTNMSRFRQGRAIVTQPGGLPIKCAGGPQKIMWLGLDKWKQAGLYNPHSPQTGAIQITFATSMGVLFGVQKYSEKLNELREARGVEGLFGHDLIAIQGNTATFAEAGGGQVQKHFDFLHAVTKMGPHQFMKNSSLVNATGFTDVNEATTRHKSFANIWGCGDSSSLPTSKTAAAITAQAPVLVRNLLQAMDGKDADAEYDGYTSCALLTEYGKVMLAEFKYGGVPKETFGALGIDQVIPRCAFYHLKKDFFPWVYYKSMVKGGWAGPKGWMRD
jgi:NADPH-dependent 2,4-dienoyl-CoA reductase/sulfur reductase-like enzyme